MCQFTFNGNVSAINQQVGNNSTMITHEQEIEVDWNGLQRQLQGLEKECCNEQDKKILRDFSFVISEREPQRIKKFLRKNMTEFTKDILSGLTTNAVWEILKILL